MKSRNSLVQLVLSVGVLSLALVIGCSDPALRTGPAGPTGPTGAASSVDTAFDSTSGTFVPGALDRGSASAQLALEDEDFNCTNVEKTSVRLSHPGYVEFNRVGLFVEFIGVADVPVRLLVWWDYDNAPDDVHNVVFEDGDVSGSDGIITIEKIVEHTYSGISRPTERKVRVELIQEGLTGNCARNRRIVVSPEPSSGGGAFPPAVGKVGTSGVLSGSAWIVCRADTMTGWVASQGSGTYNGVAACQSLGYTGVNAWGGNCGTVCGYCGPPTETYDGGGGPTPPTNFGNTVHWRCTK